MSLSRPFREGAAVGRAGLMKGCSHPHLAGAHPQGHHAPLQPPGTRHPRHLRRPHGPWSRRARAPAKTECFLYPVVSRCLSLRDEGAPTGISAVIVYPMNALAEDQLMRLRRTPGRDGDSIRDIRGQDAGA